MRLQPEEFEKFLRQVRYGRPKKAAIEGVKRGIKMAREFARTGKVILRLPKPPG